MFNSSFHWISHRGNLTGPNSKCENHPQDIQEALDFGFEVEIDIWYWKDEFWLGHDRPEYHLQEGNDKIDLRDDRLWCHAKNLLAFEKMYKNSDIRCFWHTDENIILTSKGDIWTYPGIKLLPGAILVCPEEKYRMDGILLPDAGSRFAEDIQYYLRELGPFVGNGICSDYIQIVRDKLS